jgi:uncharacterized protein YqeY
MMALQEQLVADMKAALRAQDPVRLGTIRLLRAALQNAEKALGQPLGEAAAAEVVRREIKRRQEAIEAYRRGGREDLVAQEEAELEVLQAYQAEPLSEAELTALARQVIQAEGATSRKDLGRVMKALMPRVQGRADGKLVNTIVGALLENAGD